MTPQNCGVSYGGSEKYKLSPILTNEFKPPTLKGKSIIVPKGSLTTTLLLPIPCKERNSN